MRIYRLKRINRKLYNVYYISVNNTFAYFIGVILGDGSVDKRKIYITGGFQCNFLDNLYKKAQEFSRYLRNKVIKVIYFDSKGSQTYESDPNVSFWRLYIYWSALARSLRNKDILRETLNAIWNSPESLNSFTAGMFDADGYLVYSKGKPVRIAIQQTADKWWFPLFYEKLKGEFLIKCYKRTRPYRIRNRGKIYTGISKSLIIEWYMSAWPKFVDRVMVPFSLNYDKIERAYIFRKHSLKMKNRIRVK